MSSPCVWFFLPTIQLVNESGLDVLGSLLRRDALWAAGLLEKVFVAGFSLEHEGLSFFSWV